MAGAYLSRRRKCHTLSVTMIAHLHRFMPFVFFRFVCQIQLYILSGRHRRPAREVYRMSRIRSLLAGELIMQAMSRDNAAAFFLPLPPLYFLSLPFSIVYFLLFLPGIFSYVCIICFFLLLLLL